MCTESCRASLQLVVALSTTEFEYMAMVDTTKGALWLKGLIGEFGVKQNLVQIDGDSQNAIHFIKNHMYHEKTKHIDVRMHFIRDVISSGTVKVSKIHTKKNLADFITKAVSVLMFEKC